MLAVVCCRNQVSKLVRGMFDIEKSCAEAVRQYIAVSIEKRDLLRILEADACGVSGFGTGLPSHEIISSPGISDEAGSENRTYATVSYTIDTVRCIPLGDMYCIAMVIMSIESISDAEHLIIHDLRQTIVFRFFEDRSYQITYVHASFPADRTGISRDMGSGGAGHDFLHSSNLREAYRDLRTFINTDQLTQLLSRRRIEEMIQLEMRRFERYNSPFCLVFIDLDNFKILNDALGHLFGDHVLMQFGVLLNASIRATDLAGRWGGDEFILLLPETRESEARLVIRTILRSFRELSVEDMFYAYCEQASRLEPMRTFPAFDQQQIRDRHLGFSYGVVEYSPRESFSHMFAEADARVYDMKRFVHQG
jgi:diguanylate cyclase (GGDEF)-like protein